MKFKRLLAIALSVMVMFTIGAASGVFAAGQNAGKADASAQGKDASATEATLVKYLQMPEGVNDPSETFTFTFTPVDSTNTTYGAKADEFTSTSTTIASADMTAKTTGNAADTGNKVGTKTIASIFTNYSFPHAGEYCFTVAETAGNKAGMTYASDTYTLRLIVDKGGNIDDVTVQDKDGNKVNPADADPTDNGDDVSPAASKGGFTFTNSYTKTVTTHDEPQNPNPNDDPADPNNPDPIVKTDPAQDVAGAYVLDKFVLGEYGDKTKDFVFTVTVTLPKLNKDFSFTADGNVPTVTADKGSISGTWEDGEEVTVNLKDGGQLKFPTLPVGTKIEVSEAAVDGYTKVLTTSDANDAAKVTVTEDAGGYAIMRNSFHDENVTPTGIIINNLPYILLILLAVGGIVLFARKRRYQ